MHWVRWGHALLWMVSLTHGGVHCTRSQQLVNLTETGANLGAQDEHMMKGYS